MARTAPLMPEEIEERGLEREGVRARRGEAESNREDVGT